MSALSIPNALFKIGSFAIEKWSKWRRDQFYQSFLEALQIETASGQRDPDVDHALDYLLEDEVRSEVIYDAFRRVCFTKSRKYGPRIIGLLAGKLVNEASTANEDEECVFAAAERLGDAELVQFANHYRKLLNGEPSNPYEQIQRYGDEIIKHYNDDELDSHLHDAELTPISLWEMFGPWAAQLEACGMMKATITQKSRIERVDGSISKEGRIYFSQKTSFTYRSTCKLLFDLYERARAQKEDIESL